MADRIWAAGLTPVRPTMLRRKGHARKVHPKKCYAKAGEYLLEQPDGILVQAQVGETYVEHCWVELPEGLAYDGVDAALYVTDQYRAAIRVHPETERRYTLPEAAPIIAETGEWGLLEPR